MALVVAVALLLPGSAQALVPPTVTSNADEVVAWLYRGGAQDSSVTPRCGPVCSNLWLEEHRPMPNLPSSASLHRELSWLRYKMALRASFRGLGAIGLGVTAFDVGWKIGTGIRSLFVDGDEAPSQPTAPASGTWRMIPLERGDQIAGGGSTKWQVTIYAPTDGWVLRDPQGYQAWFDTLGFERDGNCAYANGPILPVPPGFQEISRNAASSACMSGGPTVHAIWKPAPAVPPSETLPPGSWPAGYNPGVQPAYSTAKQRMLDELNNNPQNYPTLIPYLDNRLGGPLPDPIYGINLTGYACIGRTGPACAQALETAGFMDVSVVTLDAAHAAAGMPANTVTALWQPPMNAVVPQFDPFQFPRLVEWPVLPFPTTVPAPMPAVVPQPLTETTFKADVRTIVITNPDEATKPLLIPAPLPHETYEDYAARLTQLGLVPERRDLTAETLDPDRAANEAVRPDPGVDARVAPGSRVVVYTNPPDAAPPAGAGMCAPASVRPFDLTPLQVPVGEKFPFGVFSWLFGALGGWSGAGAAPVLTIPFVESELVVDFGLFDPAMAIVRPVLAILAFLSLAWLLAASALGIGAAHGDD